MDKPLVSIIIPIYNSENYITDTVQSCLNQSFDDFELLLINDGSTDRSESLIERFTDKRIRYFRTQNTGACNARNYGISQAHGKLIQFLDHDDVLDELKLEQQVKSYQQWGNDYLYSGTMGTISGNRRVIDDGFKTFQKNFEPQQFFEEKFKEFGKDIVTGAWLVPMDLVLTTHGWDPAAGLNDDGEYFMRIILNSKGIIYCKKSVFYFRRDVPNSLSKQFGSKEIYAKWLNSYKLYVKNFLKKLNQQKANELGWKSLSIYYCNAYPHHPDLLQQCKDEMKKLGYRQPAPYGGKPFVTVANVIGVDNALRIWALKNKIKQ